MRMMLVMFRLAAPLSLPVDCAILAIRPLGGNRIVNRTILSIGILLMVSNAADSH